MADGWTIVLDIGKSIAKATLWDDGGMLCARRSRTNPKLDSDGYWGLDAVGIERWLTGVLADFARFGPVGAIVPVAHGAGAALIRDGRLQCLPVDYEWPGVAEGRGAYDRRRESFVITGSPALPAGLNLGIQLHWLDGRSASDLRSARIVPWAQYWAWLLSGVLASEFTSVGCHTDLWRPFARTPSSLAISHGWAERLAPLTPARNVLGTLRKNWAEHTGLSRNVEILCGLHDSNAALLS